MNDNPTDAKEQYELGKKYYWGEGVPEDKEKAIYWYTKAAEQDHFDACCSLRSFYLKKDPATAEYWHERSIRAGSMNYVRHGTVLGEQAVSSVSSGNLKKIIIFIVATIVAVFVAIEVGIAVFFVGKLKESDSVTMSAEAATNSIDKQTDMGMGATMAAPIEITVNISGEEGRYLKCGVQLEYDATDEQLGTELEARKASIRDIVIDIMSSKSLSDLMSSDGKKAIRDQIVTKVNNILPTEVGGKPLGKVRRSYFDSFVMQ